MRSSTRGPVGSFRRAQGQSPSRGLQSLMRISAWCRVVLGDFTPQERGRGGRTVSRGMQGSLLAVSGALGLREPWGCRRTRPRLVPPSPEPERQLRKEAPRLSQGMAYSHGEVRPQVPTPQGQPLSPLVLDRVSFLSFPIRWDRMAGGGCVPFRSGVGAPIKTPQGRLS